VRIEEGGDSFLDDGDSSMVVRMMLCINLTLPSEFGHRENKIYLQDYGCLWLTKTNVSPARGWFCGIISPNRTQEAILIIDQNSEKVFFPIF